MRGGWVVLLSDQQYPTPQSLWRHFKGGLYLVICVAKDSETQEEVVVYRERNTTKNWTRPLKDWHLRDGKPRFTPIFRPTNNKDNYHA